MLHEKLADYLLRVEQCIEALSSVYVERYTEEIITPKRVNLRIRIRYQCGQLLEINEAVILQQEHLHTLDYRYHAQDANNHILFRYDNTPHFPDLETFPHHKHLPDQTIASVKPDVVDVVNELSVLLGMSNE